MVKLTRNSYKRKIILFGVLIFASIALISTGFAAWIMSSNAQKEPDGNISVGQVVDSSLKITNEKITPASFIFEPEKDDLEGRVRGDGSIGENLSVTVTATISPLTYLKTLTVKLTVPEGIKKAVELGYIVLPEEYVTETGKLITGYNTSEASYELSETITFAWGETFGGQNPGNYYDDDPVGKEVDDSVVKTHLENLRACVYGYYDELTAPGANREEVIDKYKDIDTNETKKDQRPKFVVTITAKAD